MKNTNQKENKDSFIRSSPTLPHRVFKPQTEMGNTLSELIDKEETSWIEDHKLGVEQQLGQEYRNLVQTKFGRNLRICYKKDKICGVEYQHWFVTDGTWTIEFGSGDISNNKVVVHCNPKNGYIIADQFQMTREVKNRMLEVCGASNYSLALRNCEHVARYIQSGVWVCFQMAKGSGLLYKVFKNRVGRYSRLINTPPIELQPPEKDNPELIHPEFDEDHHIRFIIKKQVLTDADNNCVNVVFLGPTGSGKSTLINNLFNRGVVEARASASSVTRNVQFIEGSFISVPVDPDLRNQWTTKKINVIDTIGMCDSFFTPEQIFAMVKTNIKLNLAKIDKVVIVCSGRIEKQHADMIKQFMKWLQYSKNKNRFCFIYNKSDQLTEAEKVEGLLQMCEMLGADTKDDSYLAPVRNRNKDKKTQRQIKHTLNLGFPPNAQFHEVKKDLIRLNQVATFDVPQIPRIELSKSNCTIL